MTDPRRDPRHGLFDISFGLVDVEIVEEPDEYGPAWRLVCVYDDGTRREAGRNRSLSAASRSRNRLLRSRVPGV